MTMHARNEALLRRVREAEDPEGRLPLPDMAEWDIFPFEGRMQVKHLEAPEVPEPPRHGEGGRECGSCAAGLADAIWADERWKLVAPERHAMPTVLLCPIEHADLADLGPIRAAELGERIWRVERALHSLGGVGRVHINKWGDGGAHLHVWCIARPEGFLQLRGSSLPEWLDILPPMADFEWERAMSDLAEEMTLLGGRALR